MTLIQKNESPFQKFISKKEFIYSTKRNLYRKIYSVTFKFSRQERDTESFIHINVRLQE
jgi:hypothetical protein